MSLPHLRHFSIWLLVLCAALASHPAGAGAAVSATTGSGTGYTISLPLIIANGTPLAPPPHTEESFAQWAQDLNSTGVPVATYRSSVAVDRAGGIHMAYTRYGSGADGQTPAIYAFCAASCANQLSWTRIHLSAAVLDAEIQIDSQIHPRMLLYGSANDPNSDLRMLYSYATCDTGCTNPAAWTITPLVAPIEALATRSEHNNHYFALDTQGRPAFIYTDTTNNNHPGTWYAYCSGQPAACSSASNWSETQLSPVQMGNASLIFTPANQPRLIADFYNAERSTNEVWYAACDTGCDTPNGWGWNYLWDMHGSGRAHLRLAPQGRPRIIFYSGTYASAPFTAGRLYYAWCDDNCASSQWSFSDLGLPTMAGSEVDLAIDAQGRPRVTYADHNQGLSYAWCNNACESGQATWQAVVAESSAALSNDFDVLPIHRCTVSAWFNGNRPWLALDAAGNPRIGYDAQHWWYGVESAGGTGRQCNDQDITVTRIAQFPQPAP